MIQLGPNFLAVGPNDSSLGPEILVLGPNLRIPINIYIWVPKFPIFCDKIVLFSIKKSIKYPLAPHHFQLIPKRSPPNLISFLIN